LTRRSRLSAIACDRPVRNCRERSGRDSRRVLGQIVGDREPRRLVDKRVRAQGERRDHRRASPARRHRAPRRQGQSARCASVRRISPAPARCTLTESPMRARCRLVSRDKLLADEKAKIGGDARPRAEWRAMCLLALPVEAMRGSHQGTVNLEAHPPRGSFRAARSYRRVLGLLVEHVIGSAP
jgi:hypothetical protein